MTSEPRLMLWMRVLPVRLRLRWIAIGGSWRVTVCVVAGVAVLFTATAYIPVFGSVGGDSFGYRQNPVPWLVLGFFGAAASWLTFLVLTALPLRRPTFADSRRAASEMLILLAPLSFLINLFHWLFR
jgi:hypothetical protein